MTCRIKNRKFSLKALAKWLRTEKFYFDSLTLNVCGRQNFLIFNSIQYYVTILVEEKRLRSFVEWWVLSGHMTQIILTSSLQTIWWKYWPSTCASGEILFVFLEIFKQDTIMNYYSTTKVSRKYTLHIICIANLLLILRSTSYGNLKKLDVLYALIFLGLQEV